MQVEAFVFDRSPKSFDEDIILPGTAAVHLRLMAMPSWQSQSFTLSANALAIVSNCRW